MKTMKIMGMIAGLALALTVTQQAKANSVTGSITFSGGATLDSTSVGNATEVTGWTNATVTSASGSFAGITSVVFKAPYIFNSPLGDPGLWTAGAFTFNLIQSAIVYPTFPNANVNGLYVAGTGFITAAGYTPTLGSWTFSASNPGSGTPLVFSFQAAVGSLAVPDGGMTVALLGGALIGLQVVRSKMRR